MERIWTSGVEFIITSNIKLEIKVDVYPRKKVNVSLIAIKRQISIPWTAKAIYNIDNKRITKDIGGVWKGTVVYNVKTVIEGSKFFISCNTQLGVVICGVAAVLLYTMMNI